LADSYVLLSDLGRALTRDLDPNPAQATLIDWEFELLELPVRVE